MAAKPKAKDVAADAPEEPTEAPVVKSTGTGWRDPNAKYADNDTSIDARMWRLNRDHQEMGSR